MTLSHFTADVDLEIELGPMEIYIYIYIERERERERERIRSVCMHTCIIQSLCADLVYVCALILNALLYHSNFLAPFLLYDSLPSSLTPNLSHIHMYTHILFNTIVQS
jgi:hypothetical protein